MGSRQTEADGKKNIVDFTASGLKSKKLIILVLSRINDN